MVNERFQPNLRQLSPAKIQESLMNFVLPIRASCETCSQNDDWETDRII